MKFSVIIPVLREEGLINQLIGHVEGIFSGYDHEIIVSDGDENGSTINRIDAKYGKNIIRIISPRGRGVQMNMGAAHAAGNVLVFLHADTFLPHGAAGEIESFVNSGYTAGAFDTGFDHKSCGMNTIAFFARLRSRITRIPFGDQAVFIKKDFFSEIGGYMEIPLMEDVEIMKRIRRRGVKIVISKLRVTTSARKWVNEGVVKNTLRNWRNRLLYKIGWSPERLARYYYGGRFMPVAVLLLTMLLPAGVKAVAGESIHLTFSSLSEWEPLLFPKIKNHSRYSVSSENGKSVLLCESDGSASGLILKRTFSIRRYTKLRWRWKIEYFRMDADPLKKSGDDYPLRIYIIFKYDPDNATFYEKAEYNAAKLVYGEYPPHSSLNYVWCSRDVPYRSIASPYTGRVKLVLLEKGHEKINTWVTEEVNILEDYRNLFGKNPPETASLAIMSDSDNTGGSARGYIEFIELK